MSRNNRRPLPDRVAEAAAAALAVQHFVRPIDVFVRIGWLDGGSLRRWQQGQIESLEVAIQTSMPRIAEAMTMLRAWANEKGLYASEATYVARTPQRQALRFSRSGDPTTELLYRTHWVCPELSEHKRQRLAEKVSRPPELVVVEPLNNKWKCHRCGGTGHLLVMENPGPACLRCVGLDDLEFLTSGNALLTRRAKAKSERHAVVVRFSKSRRRYERQGLLVEPRALSDAQRELEEQERGR